MGHQSSITDRQSAIASHQSTNQSIIEINENLKCPILTDAISYAFKIYININTLNVSMLCQSTKHRLECLHSACARSKFRIHFLIIFLRNKRNSLDKILCCIMKKTLSFSPFVTFCSRAKTI